MNFVRTIAAALLLSVAVAPIALADNAGTGVAGHWQFRLRGVAVIPDASGTVKVAGIPLAGSVSVTNSFIPEVDATYFLTDHIGFEVIAGTTQHSVHQTTAGDVGSVWLLPPTLTAQYHFSPDSSLFRPYVGAGINYTFFYSPRSPLPNVGYSNNFGWALQAGTDVPLGSGPYFLNFDVKKIFLTTEMKAEGGIIQTHATLNPWLIGAGVGVRF